MIYLDSNATTFPVPSLTHAMQPFLENDFGNPSSSSYQLGKQARDAIEEARVELSLLVDCRPDEIVFTSGGTEAISIAILGATSNFAPGATLLESSIEHVAVREAFQFAAKNFSHSIEFVSCKKDGVIDLLSLETKKQQRNISLTALMWANNETGVIQPVGEMADKPEAERGLLLVDAVQAVGKTPVSFRNSGAHFLCLSAHKFGGPKGIGALVIRDGVKWVSPFYGGGQERGRRGGTESVPLIVGMGVAAKYARLKLDSGEADRLENLRDLFEDMLLENFPAAKIVGESSARLSNTSFFMIPGVIAGDIVSALGERNICVSAGSACKTGQFAASHVLTSMGYSSSESISAIRVSFGSRNNEQEVHKTISVLREVVNSKKEEISNKLGRILS